MFSFTRALRLGLRGQDVQHLQERLNTLGFDAGLQDGIFGVQTQQAVIQFQTSQGLEADGIVGLATYRALFDLEGRARVLVNLAQRRLYLYLDDILQSSYPVAIGKPSTPTPTGTFAVTEKAMNPGGVFGTRWIRFFEDYGIHGTNNPASIGNAVSNGCIRMFNDDVNFIYAVVTIGTEVRIIPSERSFRTYTVQPGDTLYSIALRFGVSFEDLVRANAGVANTDVIFVGQELVIP
ncbi:LysM domain-containing protein [Geosporobacter subterraneus DSM 17957]|uniref:LysM domain-containing protein n=1 Tax=Geosporobacter subterraneus DSM 17957 TaxID=1121919 RepID=A0A1M6QN43_9FIRM|nr:L,D-transpeptidase family protein [Geosporobacter subterraneus]SHK21661.1 LysM domain-containing protein [Geosporobacter subterraneus DSM 17957]